MSGVVHRAGPMVAWVQKCERCGAVIQDHSNSAWPEGDPAPSGFPVGDVTVYGGNPRVTMTGSESDAVECTPPQAA